MRDFHKIPFGAEPVISNFPRSLYSPGTEVLMLHSMVCDDMPFFLISGNSVNLKGFSGILTEIRFLKEVSVKHLFRALTAGLAVLLCSGMPAVSVAATDTLVVYFSASGRTETAASVIAGELKADTFAINPAVPYSVKDLDYRDPESRSSREHQDPSLRPEYSGEVAGWDRYGTVYIGYPIWWGEAPNIVYTFVEKHDFTGKTVITFSTSGSSGHGASGDHLAEKAGSGNWKPGRRFSSNVNTSEIRKWLKDSR